MKRLRWFVVPLLTLMMLGGCGSKDAKDKDRFYDVKAKVVSIDAGKKTVTLDHEDIPGFMKAMEMKFSVEDPKVLEGIKPRDEVSGKLRVKPGNDYAITELRKR